LLVGCCFVVRRPISSSSQKNVSCSTPQKSQHPGSVKCACQNVHVVTEMCMS
jgi:hypothetical protein